MNRLLHHVTIPELKSRKRKIHKTQAEIKKENAQRNKEWRENRGKLITDQAEIIEKQLQKIREMSDTIESQNLLIATLSLQIKHLQSEIASTKSVEISLTSSAQSNNSSDHAWKSNTSSEIILAPVCESNTNTNRGDVIVSAYPISNSLSDASEGKFCKI